MEQGTRLARRLRQRCRRSKIVRVRTIEFPRAALRTVHRPTHLATADIGSRFPNDPSASRPIRTPSVPAFPNATRPDALVACSGRRGFSPRRSHPKRGNECRRQENVVQLVRIVALKQLQDFQPHRIVAGARLPELRTPLQSRHCSHPVEQQPYLIPALAVEWGHRQWPMAGRKCRAAHRPALRYRRVKSGLAIPHFQNATQGPSGARSSWQAMRRRDNR